ncbi:MAG: hypothetical protein ABW196_08330 [Solirubrobacterales bacterium]
MSNLDLGGSPLSAWSPSARSNGVRQSSDRLAWQYLLPDHLMARRVDTLDVHSARRWSVSMEVDFEIPALPTGAMPPAPNDRCFIPIAFFARHRVAPDLEVRNSAGEVISVPTKKQNMDFTAQALAQISAEAAATFNRPPAEYELSEDHLKLAGDVIRKESHHARVCRFKIEELDPRVFPWLLPLLRRFEDNFVLWVPVPGEPGTEHHLSIRRSDWRWLDPIFPKKRRKEVEIKVSTSVGEVQATWDPPYKWLRGLPNLPAAAGRLLIACGLMPVTLKNEAFEAHRFSSYHFCVAPPAGFVLRELQAGEIREADWKTAKPRIHRIRDELDRSIGGQDSRMGHVHLAMPTNPSRLFTRATIGLRPETITLWALVAVFTCGLLWAFHRNIEDIASLTDKAQIAIGVLLVGPTFASAWTLREKDRALMRSTLSGTRLLMLASASLSVATALAIAGLRPFGWEVGQAVSWYASISYTIAAIIVVGWLQTRWIAWFVFRDVLTKTKWNLLATAILALGSYLAISEFSDFPALATGVLILTGFAFAVVAANRSSVPLGEVAHLPAALAGVAAIVTLAIASRELTFYNYLADKGEVHEWGMSAELSIAGAAAAMLLVRYSLRLYRRRKTAKVKSSLQKREIVST